MSELVTPEAVHERIAGLAAPLREQLAEVDEACVAKQRELAALREIQRELRGALRVIDPSFSTAAKKAKTNGGRRRRWSPRREAFVAYLRSNAEQLNVSGFSAPQLAQTGEFGSRSNVTKLLSDLHDEGLLRLDRVEGNAKIFKVV